MKNMIIAAAIAFVGSFASAGALDVQDPYAGVTPNYHAVTKCTDGQTAWFQEPKAGNSDRYVNVLRTCVNGRYYPKSTTVGKGCKEGAVGFWQVAKAGNSDRYDTVKFTCVNGKYVRN